MSDGEQDHTESVRRRAYHLWEQAGQPDGRHDEFWHQAGNENMSGDNGRTIDTQGSTSPEDSSQGSVDPKPVVTNSKVK